MPDRARGRAATTRLRRQLGSAEHHRAGRRHAPVRRPWHHAATFSRDIARPVSRSIRRLRVSEGSERMDCTTTVLHLDWFESETVHTTRRPRRQPQRCYSAPLRQRRRRAIDDHARQAVQPDELDETVDVRLGPERRIRPPALRRRRATIIRSSISEGSANAARSGRRRRSLHVHSARERAWRRKRLRRPVLVSAQRSTRWIVRHRRRWRGTYLNAAPR